MVGTALLLNGCLISSSVMQKKSTDSETTVPEAPIKERRTSKKVTTTFLDTLNAENEIVLQDNDFDKNSPSTNSESVTGGSLQEQLFRVQVFASNNIENVREQKKELEKNTNEPIVIGYDAPYYKLYAGGYTKKQDAQVTLTKLKKTGYPDAWIVAVKDKP